MYIKLGENSKVTWRYKRDQRKYIILYIYDFTKNNSGKYDSNFIFKYFFNMCVLSHKFN